MATGSTLATPPSAKSGTLLEYDQFIDKQLRHTRAQVRTVDVISGLLLLATGTLAYFFVVALIDHWVIAGGLPGWARLTTLGAYLAVAGWYFITRVLPLFVRRINPLYAAETIERTQPSLKNSLLNFLMFRARPQGLPESVYHAIEEQAAAKLARVPIESVVDRSKLINVGYVLSGVLAVCALYKVLSPKDPLTSVGRVVMPWADILPPTRVTIEQIEPGSAKAFRGQQINVSAEVRGLARDAKVTLFYSTADGQTVDRQVDMHVPQAGYRHTCTLPPDEDGMQQTVQYRIVAGDARSRDYTLTVVAAPTIVVDSVEYVYPSYTGLQTQTIERQGDIKAIEGTRINLHAVTNQPIQSGGLDFECDEQEDLPLAVDGTGDSLRGATVSFSLELEPDRATAQHSSYQLRFKNAEGDQNQQPIRHAISVVPDLSPVVEFLAPKKDEVLVREGDVLPIELTAGDPDFALKQVNLFAEVDGRSVMRKSLLRSDWRGQFNHKFRLNTRELGLKAGDVVEYWAKVEDIKSPQSNIAETPHRRVRIVPRDAQGQPNDDLQGGGEQPPLAGEPEDPQQGEDGEQGDQPADQHPQEGGDHHGDQKQPAEKNQGGDQQRENSGDAGGEGENAADKKEPGENSGDEKSGDEQSGDEQKGGDQDDKQGDAKQDGQSGDQNQSGQPQQGGSGDQQSGQTKEITPNDGSNDGEAFDKAMKHLQENDQKNPQSQNQKPGEGQTKTENPGSQESKNQNKQTPGQNEGGTEKPSDKKQQPGDTEEGGGEEQGNENKGEEQPGQSNNPNAEKKPAESGGARGQEQAGDASEDAKSGENSQKGEHTDHVSKNAKEQQGDPSQGGQSEKIGERERPYEQAQDCPHCQGKGCDKCNGMGKSGGSKSGNPRDQQGGQKSKQGGQGEHAKGDDREGEQKPGDAKSQDKAKGGSGEQEKGESGAGRNSSNDEGAPESQGDNQQKNKTPKPAGEQQDDEGKTEAQSPSNSNKQSDSKEGESEGDRSGAGKAGGGQKANQPGSGGAGKNTASDEGAGQSEEQGDGESSGKAGQQQESNKTTGESGNEAGEGSQSKPGDKSGKGKPGENQPSRGEPSENKDAQAGAPGDGGAQGTQTGGGKTEQNAAEPHKQPGGEPGGDAANLEYARKATDLVLNRLRDQLDNGQVDQELLDELGWTADDLDKFVRRWEQMRNEAHDENRPGNEAKRELDATLRSLGLRPRGTTLGGNRAADDTQRGLKESRRTSPPADYAEQYKQYLQGTARGGK